jgi:hypothetical protein
LACDKFAILVSQGVFMHFNISDKDWSLLARSKWAADIRNFMLDHILVHEGHWSQPRFATHSLHNLLI